MMTIVSYNRGYLQESDQSFNSLIEREYHPK